MTKIPVLLNLRTWIFLWYTPVLQHKMTRNMKAEDFEKRCQMMMDAPSFGWNISVAFDNEFYARFGMSASEALAILRLQKRRTHNQKHSPIY